MTSTTAFLDTLRPVIDLIRDRALDGALKSDLDMAFPPGSPTFEAIRAACRSGVEDGWMGLEGDDRRKGGRVIEPTPECAGCSVDVVEIADLTGPHHAHPRGEVCAVLAVTPGVEFDGNPEGWAVYPAGSAHWPSAKGGRLRVMFFLPGGEIDYTDSDATLRSGSAEG